MTKRYTSLILCAFFLLLTATAFAGTDANGVSILMTDNNTIIPTTSKTTFTLSETPFLFFGFPAEFNKINITGSFWLNPTPDLSGVVFDTSSNTNKFLSLSNWNTVKQLGEWKVAAFYAAANSSVITGCDTLKFTVTPEPLSSALFLLGSAAVALKARRKKHVV